MAMNTKHRIIMATVTVAVAVAMIAVYTWLVGRFGFMPRCPFKWVTGLACPGCGSQRALMALLHGHPVEAVGYNYLLPFAVAYLALLGAHRLFPDSRRVSALYRRLTTPFALMVVAAVTVVWMVARNIAGC